MIKFKAEIIVREWLKDGKRKSKYLGWIRDQEKFEALEDFLTSIDARKEKDWK